MADEILDDTEVELEQVEETTELEQPETVEEQSFDDDLESAETDEDFAKLGDSLREEPIAEEDPIDNEVEVSKSSFNIGDGFAIKDGDVELNIQDEAKLRQLAQMGLNYAGKTTELAKYRSFVKYAEDKGISLEDMQMLNDIKGGNKDAYSALAKASNIDVYDVSEEHDYTPEAPRLDPVQDNDPMVDTIANEILANEDYTAQFQKWLPHMPEDVQREVTTNSHYLRGVQRDIQDGIFDKSMNQAYSYMKLENMDFGSAYSRAKSEFNALSTPKENKPQVTRGDRQRAASSRSAASKSKSSYGAGVVADMGNDEFLENFNDIISSLQRPN